jgi:rod shape-determining protein MreD
VRALVSFVLTAVTVVVQLTIVDRIAFPGGGGPDLVLLLVAALALAGGPMAGVLTGFSAGLALDVAPPGSHFTGEDALVFCLIGYACGLLADDFSGDAEQGRSALFEIVVTAVGAVCGEALVALLGVMLSDPRVSWPAITNVLPAAVAYDVLLCPFALYAAAASLRLAGVRREGHRPGWSAGQARSQRSATSQGAIRQLAGGSGPRLRLSERDRSPGSASALRGSGAGRPPARREPQLKLGRPAARAGVAFAAGGLAAGSARVQLGGGRGKWSGGRVKWSGRRREGVLGGSMLGVSGRRSARLGGSAMGRSLLGGSVFGRSVPLGRSAPLRHRGNLMRSAGGGLAGRTPRLSRGTPKSPGRNWLRGASARGVGGSSLGGSGLRRAKLGGKGLGGRSMGRKAFGRSRIGQPRGPKLNARRRWGKRGYL